MLKDDVMCKIVPPSIQHAWAVIHRSGMQEEEWVQRYISPITEETWKSTYLANVHQVWTGLDGCGGRPSKVCRFRGFLTT